MSHRHEDLNLVPRTLVKRAGCGGVWWADGSSRHRRECGMENSGTRALLVGKVRTSGCVHRAERRCVREERRDMTLDYKNLANCAVGCCF